MAFRQLGLRQYPGSAGQNTILPASGVAALTMENASAFDSSLGTGYTYVRGSVMAQETSNGWWLLGPNPLVARPLGKALASTDIADWAFSTSTLRSYGSSGIEIRNIHDPPDIILKRGGSPGSRPYGNGATVMAVTDLQGLGSNGIMGQYRGAGAIIPFGGTTGGGNGKFSGPHSGTIAFRASADDQRDLTGNNDFAIGTRITVSLAATGYGRQKEVLRMFSSGHIVSYNDVTDDPTPTDSARLNLVNNAGQNEQQKLAVSSPPPTAGSFTLDWYGACPTNGTSFLTLLGTTGTLTISPGHPTAAEIKTALEAVNVAGLQAGDLTVTGGPLDTADVTIEWTSAAVKNRNYAKLHINKTGFVGNVSVTKAQDGYPVETGTDIVRLQSAIGATGEYLILVDGSGNTVGRWRADKTLHLYAASAPADATLGSSELAVWLDDTVGATKVQFKAKDSGGTVRTGNVALT